MKVVFGSVVYKSAEKYLNDFLMSLQKQKESDFSIIIINDDIETKQLNNIFSNYLIEIECKKKENLTPIQLRVELLKQAKYENADLLILGDCDDCFSDMRVNNIISEYKKNNDMAFFYNEIVDMSGRKLMPELPDIVYGCEDIGEYNFLGMSNTAVNLNKLDIKFIESLNEYKYDIFDWYFYTRILLLGLKGKKVDDCSTLYRLHANNMVGIAERNKNNIMREIEVKKKHYKILSKYNKYYLEKYYEYQKKDEIMIEEKNSKYYWWNFTK